MQSFRTNILNIYNKDGEKWLANLNKYTSRAATKYALSDLKPVPNLTFNYVLDGFQNSRPIILKLSLDSGYIAHEANALRAFEKFGAVKIIAEEKGMLLMERAMPGTSLIPYFPSKELESTDIAGKLITRLHKLKIPSNKQFQKLEEWMKLLEKDWPISTEHLIKARSLYKHLLKTTKKSVLLHGDMHHDNILKNGNDWVVIDPKGIIGDPIYEITAFMRNPIPKLLSTKNAKEILQRRLSLFSKLLNSSYERAYNWCFVQSVLSQAWAIEDNRDASYHKSFTEVLHAMA